MGGSVTQRDVAEHCGVTVGTVSLALREDPRISRATTQRIQAAAKELGYPVLVRPSYVLG
ncbi:MAG TPA: LacI family DNA-binding transcriptional regulator, partial [Armatimonadota bacterium]|nr:LacI family DNA-binding transcriptional regulator [Armatimonadota bacterium]